MNLEQILGRKICVLDGAMGTQLLSQGAKGCLELLNVDNAEQVAAIHNAYLEAGADIITTNTIILHADKSEEDIDGIGYELYNKFISKNNVSRIIFCVTH